MDSYGPLTDVVKLAGAIMAAGMAITLTWRGRARWEPVEEDVPKGPQKVGGLFAAVVIAVLFVSARPEAVTTLGWTALGLGILCVLSLLGYTYLIRAQTYDVIRVERKQPKPGKIIGGFQFTPYAEEVMRKRGIGPQAFLSGVQYDPESVWTRSSIALAHLAFTLAYILLVVSGTIALAAAAIMLSYRV